MANENQIKSIKPEPVVELVEDSLSTADLNDLCDATDAAIESGGGFGWIELPSRDILERYWQGVIAMPSRMLFVARLDGVICGTAQVIPPAKNNEAQSFAVQLTGVFVAPWARKYGLARLLMERAEETARREGYSVMNLDVRETQEAAIRLYESMGFVQIGTHPYYAQVGGQVIPGRYYYKAIDPKAVERAIEPLM